VDLTEDGALEAVLSDTTRAVFFETPANPTLDIIDIQRIADIVAKANENRSPDGEILTIVDNTFATPYCQRPLKYGADFAVHSLTKNVMGFGTDMGGMVAGPAKYHSDVRMARKDFGGVVSPRAAWNILVYGISSLPVRSDKQQANALEIARYLESRPEVGRVLYPGLESHPHHEIARRQMRNFDDEFAPGIMVYFEIGGKGEALFKRASKFIDYIAKNSYTMTLAVSLGQMKTLIEAPALMTHCVYGDAAEDAGMSLGGVRLSLGVENPKDIIQDLEAAFAVI
jgi:methionine-gamma-lyase